MNELSPKKPLARTNSGKRNKRNNESSKPEELLVDSAESLDLGPSEMTWNSWEEKLDSVQEIKEKVHEEPPLLKENDAQQDENAEVPKDRTEEMVEPDKDPDEQMDVELPNMTDMDRSDIQSVEIQPVPELQSVPENPSVPIVEVEENANQEQAAEPPSRSDIGKEIREFSDDDNDLMIDENFGAGQEFLKFRNRSLDNDDSAASGPISDILENAAALSGVSPESESKFEITNDFEIEKVETMNECIEISDEDDDEPITKLIQSNNKKPQTGKLQNVSIFYRINNVAGIKMLVS